MLSKDNPARQLLEDIKHALGERTISPTVADDLRKRIAEALNTPSSAEVALRLFRAKADPDSPFSSKIAEIKHMRELFGFSLADAKEFVETH